MYDDDFEGIRLNIGCGKDWKKQEGFEGVDIVDFGQE